MKKSASIFQVLSLQLTVFLLITGLVACGLYFRKDILIKYHLWGQKSALEFMKKYSTNPAMQEKSELYQEEYLGHKKALISLGYLAERTFNTQYLTPFGPEMKQATAEFRQIRPGCSYSIGGTSGTRITITCPADAMSVWEELIEKYDVPPEDANQPASQDETAKHNGSREVLKDRLK